MIPKSGHSKHFKTSTKNPSASCQIWMTYTVQKINQSDADPPWPDLVKL